MPSDHLARPCPTLPEAGCQHQGNHLAPLPPPKAGQGAGSWMGESGNEGSNETGARSLPPGSRLSERDARGPGPSPIAGHATSAEQSPIGSRSRRPGSVRVSLPDTAGSAARSCARCGSPLPEGAQPHRRYCSDTCRYAARDTPERNQAQWLRRRDRDGLTTQRTGLVCLCGAVFDAPIRRGPAPTRCPTCRPHRAAKASR